MKKTISVLMILGAMLVGAAAEKPTAVSQVPWKLPLYSLTARSMPLRQALDTFGTAEGISIVMSKAVNGSFSGEFKNVPASEFLDRLTKSHNLIWYYDGSALYIYGSGEVQTILLELKYMKAQEVQAILNELGVEDARYPIKRASNDELIMVSGPPRYVMLVSETIERADKLRELRTFNQVETRVFPLINTWADDVTFNTPSPESTRPIRGVARILEEMMTTSIGSSTRESSTNSTDKADALEQKLGAEFRPVIRPDNRLNAVIVRDVSTRMPMYEKIIKQLDVPQKLVEIGVTVLELSREDALDWQLSLKAEAVNDDKVQGGVGQNVQNIFDTASMGGKGLAGAITYLGEDVTVSGSLSALREKGKARSISRTSLLTLNNLAAELSDTQSYHARVVGTEVASLEEVQAGTKLQIMPRIVKTPDTNSPRKVWLSMELQDGGFEAVTVDAMPMTRTSTLQTQASVKEGHSILLAGYMRDIKESAGWGIPYLRDIPWIGWLFGGSSTRNETIQRMFILTPYIVDADLPDLTSVQALRQRDITQEEHLEFEKDAYDAERKEREAQMEERRRITEEHFEDLHERNTGEREFRQEKRSDRRKAAMEKWEENLEKRKEKYEAEKEAAEEKNKE